jgi:hypothetical protein
MGKQVKNRAIQLGLTNQPKYTFYARPKKIKAKFSKIKPDIAYTIEDWMKGIDSSAAMSESAGGRSSKYFYLAPELKTYVEIADKLSGAFAYSEENHACKIDIYTENEDYVRAIVKGINDIWDDGIIPHLNIKKLESKYKVSGEDIINAWKAFI